MQRSVLADAVDLYSFPAREGTHYPLNIVALRDPEAARALLIDVAFEKQAAAVSDELARQGCVVTDVVLSHFHDDHFEGLRAIGGVTLHASPRSQAAIDASFGPEERAFLTPDDPLTDGSSLTFGPHELRFVEAPGHSPCSLLSVIDDRFVHVGDLLMSAADGTPLLPYVAYTNVPIHIRTLERLRDRFADRTLLLGHGPPLQGQEKVRAAIEQRLCYLRGVLRGNGHLSYDEVMRDCAGTFLHTEWHAMAPEVTG